jgi:hypothetical protein
MELHQLWCFLKVIQHSETSLIILVLLCHSFHRVSKKEFRTKKLHHNISCGIVFGLQLFFACFQCNAWFSFTRKGNETCFPAVVTSLISVLFTKFLHHFSFLLIDLSQKLCLSQKSIIVLADDFVISSAMINLRFHIFLSDSFIYR